jgi:parvulin-like peptidyl-prolyl isomerase
VRKLLAVIGACVLLLLGIGSASGSAQQVPNDAVAIVGDEPISKADYDHWFEVHARSSDLASAGVPVIPDPPAYRGCIAALKERAARARKTLSQAELKARCRTRELRLRRITMTSLIQTIWLEKEAEALGVEVSAARVERALRAAKRESFENMRDYRRFLRQTGLTEGDVRAQVRTREIAAAITRHVQRGAGKDKVRRLRQFGKEFQKRWREQTECRAAFAVSEFCGNARR